MKTRKLTNISLRLASLALLATSFISLFGGIQSDTLVRTSRKKYKTVKLLSSSDKILTFSGNIDDPKLKKSKTEAIVKYETDCVLGIQTNSGNLYVGLEKKFYDYYSEKWIAAKDLTEDNQLTCWDPSEDCFYGLRIVSTKKIKLKSLIFLYDFLLEEDHVYFVIDSSGNSILVHNGLSVAAILAIKEALALLAAGTASVAPTAVSAAGTGTIILSTGGAAAGTTLYSVLAPITIPATIIGAAGYAGYAYAPEIGHGAHWCFSSSFRKRCRNVKKAAKARARAAAAATHDYSFTGNNYTNSNVFRSVPVVPETNPVVNNNLNREQPEEVPEEPIISNQTSSPTPEPPNNNNNDDEEIDSSGNPIEIKDHNREKPQEIDFRNNSKSHIFNGKGNHLRWSRQNINDIKKVANNPNNFAGETKTPKGPSNKWYSSINNKGEQMWTRVNNNKIVGAGKNSTPRNFDPDTGFCNPKG